MASPFPLLTPAGPTGNAGHPGAATKSQVIAPFVAPFPNQCVTLSVSDTSWMAPGEVVFVTGESQGYFEIMAVVNATTVVMKNLTSKPVTERHEIHGVIGYDS